MVCCKRAADICKSQKVSRFGNKLCVTYIDAESEPSLVTGDILLVEEFPDQNITGSAFMLLAEELMSHV